jgi:hypothetical protein
MTAEEGDRRLARIRASIADRFAAAPGRPLESIGVGRNAVVVRLKPNAVPIAEELSRDFGSMVEITVGFKAFPEGTYRVSLPPALQAHGSLPTIRATCELDAARLHGGDAVTGKVAMQNIGYSDIEVSASANAGWLCRPGTLQVVGGYSGLIADAGHEFHISPGGSETLNFVAGSASCEPGAGYVVEPGRYEVIVPVDLAVGGGQGAARILARDCFVEVT